MTERIAILFCTRDVRGSDLEHEAVDPEFFFQTSKCRKYTLQQGTTHIVSDASFTRHPTIPRYITQANERAFIKKPNVNQAIYHSDLDILWNLYRRKLSLNKPRTNHFRN